MTKTKSGVSSRSVGVPTASRIRRAAAAAVVAVALIGVIQRYAPATDYQYAFFASVGVGFIALLTVLYQMQRIAGAAGYRWRIPLAFGGVLLIAVILFRFETFSGEMVPQFTWRFARHQTPPMLTEPSRGPIPSVTDELSDGPADVASGSPESGESGSGESGSGESEGGSGRASVAGAPENRDSPGVLDSPWFLDSPGFLGPNRNGVIDRRGFEIPSSSDDVVERWRIGIGEGWGSFAVGGDLALTLEQRDGRECLTAYRVSDGSLAWIRDWESRHSGPPGGIGPRSTPTIDSGKVYVQGGTGQVRCFTLAGGEPVWEHDLLELAGWDQSESESAIPWGRAGSPLIVDGLCVLPFGGPFPFASPDPPQSSGLSEESGLSEKPAGGRSLIAFDAETGEVVWTAGDDQISYASAMLMTLAGQRQLVIVNEGTVTGHRIDTGETLWSFPWPGQSNASASCASAIPAGADRFLVGKGYGGGSALVEVERAEDGDFSASVVWASSRRLQTKFTHACVDGSVAYGIGNGALEAVDLDEERTLWKQSRRDRCGQGQVLLAEDVLIVQAEPGDVLLVDADPREYRALVRLDGLSSKTWNVPTLAGRTLLIRNDREAIAYELPALPGDRSTEVTR